MKEFKRTLALALVVCMLCSFLPAGALAAGNDAPSITGTSDAPFKQGTGGSNSFRIPALVTLSDGTLVAAADARWNTTYDGGGLDTMVAVSTDNGATWTHSFANYLGDNGNVYNGSSSTCFIDPALTVVSADTNNDGVAEDTIYMLVDLYPYGIALNGSGNTAPSTDTGFTDDGYLKLDYNSAGTYGYYLKDGEIYANGSSTPLNGYTVDAHFNVTNENTNPATTTNLFYADSIFKVARTGFLYLTKSTDGGESWSAPQLLNLKTSSEMVCLVGPGRGIVTYKDDQPCIVFPIYSYNGDDTSQRTGFIYSDDEGTTWNRVNSSVSWSSESAVVDLNNNSMRFFYRNDSSTLKYVDYTWDSGWGTPQTTDIATNSNTQISAISLQKTIDDQQVILVSCPAGPDGGSNDFNADYRTNGKIFLFTVDENNAMTKQGEVSVPSVHSTNSFMYSCMTALADEYGNETGDIAILYEDQQNAWGTGDDCYYQMSFKTFNLDEDFGVTLDEDSNTDIDTETPGETYENNVIVNLKVGESQTLINDTGIYEDVDDSNLNTSIATVEITGSNATTEKNLSEKVTAIESGKTYVLYNKNASKLMNNQWADASVGGGGTNGLALSSSKESFQDNDCWTITVVDGGYYVQDIDGKYLTIARGSAGVSDSPVVASLAYDGTDWTIGVNGEYANDFGGNKTAVAGWSDINDNNSQWEIYEVVTTVTSGSTEITFKGVAEGNTTAVVGNTLYKITVMPDNITDVVDIELEIGESFTYTDTTGNHVDNVIQQPDGTYATMAVSGSTNTVQKVLVPVTASTFETGKRYVIENVRAANPNHSAYQPNNSVLTSTAATGGATGLVMNGPLDANTSQTWTFTPNDNMYYVGRDNSYITLNNGNAYMSTTAQSLSFEYVDGSGWLIYYNADGNNTSNDGDYFLSDVGGNARGEAFGYTTKDDDGNYWNIYEVVDEAQIDATRVTFIGVAEGKTTAIVGNTQYNITVVPAEVDDEVMNSATDIWTVDPEVQRQRYNTIIDGKYKDLYTDESWKQYEAARQKAYKKLVEVTNAEYSSKADADAALAELKSLVDELETAAAQLVSATTISVHYTYNGTELDIREYKIASTDTSVTLPDTIVVDDIAYKVTDTTLERQGAETTYSVPVELIGKVGEGFVGSQDLNIGTHNGHAQIADLVDDDGNGKKITEMTVTVGISYDLDLGIEMLDGYTVEWVSDNDTIVTVDPDGNVTAEGEGIANITATVKDADGNIVEVNSIPVTVFPTGTDDRNTAIYIEEVTNTTVWCVVNANTNTYGFEVIEGELIYGQFDTTVSGDTKTTAMSFFGDPDEAHALVYMKSTNSDDQYFLLHDDDGNLYDGTVTGNANSAYYISGTTGGAGYWQAMGLNDNSNPDWDKIKDMVQWAIDLGCDGGLGFTRRQSEGDLASNLSFKSDPMPRIEKVVDGVLPTTRKQANYRRYVDDMVAAVHELVYFKITVTQEVPTEWQDADQTVGEIVYTNAWVRDTILPGAYLYTKELDQADGTWDGEISDGVDENGEPFRKQQIEITDQLNEAWTAEQKEAGKRVFEFYLMYEIQESDIPKFYIDNIANLDYKYDSKYSTGAQAAAADAEARISVVGSAIDNVVIDFGQSFTYEGHEFQSYTDGKTYTFTGLTNSHLKGAYVDGEYDANGTLTEIANGSGASAKYGEVKVYRTPTTDAAGNSDYIYTVEYTPTSILQTADAVQIFGDGENGQKKLINGFLVYPATTVYYEEGFLENIVTDNSNGWDFTAAKKATMDQTFELLGVSQFDNHGTLTHYISNKKQAYGFDPIYDGIEDNGEVADSSISTTTPGAAAQFTFTGTGFEIFADCNDNTGFVHVSVRNKDGEEVKMFLVNTAVKGGTSSATTGQTGDMYALPIVSLKDLPHGTYTVVLTKVMKDTNPVVIDGVRITNTVSQTEVFTVDLEDMPEFYQLRDAVLKAFNIGADSSHDYGDLTGRAQQVYNDLLDSDSETPAAVITDASSIYGDNFTIQDLLDNGPKNEIYLWPNQTLTFKVETQRVIQVGLKAPSGATDFERTVRMGETDNTSTPVSGSISSVTDMFYYLTENPVEDAGNIYLVSIKNTGSNVLAVTDLKVCDDPSAALVPLTLEDVETILRDAGYTDSGCPSAAFSDVSQDAWYHEAVDFVVSKRLMTGISDTLFDPESDLTRGQMVTVLYRLAGEPEVGVKCPFVDVPADTFFTKPAIWALENGITTGISDTVFDPYGTITREQMVTFLCRYAKLNGQDVTASTGLNSFPDAGSVSPWAYDSFCWAVEQGIISGVSGLFLAPAATTNRAQVATVLMRYLSE